MYLLRDYIGIDKDARADDASHHQHGGVECSELPANTYLGQELSKLTQPGCYH